MFLQVEGLDPDLHISPGVPGQTQVVSGYVGPFGGQGRPIGQGDRYIVVHGAQDGFPAQGGGAGGRVGPGVVGGELGYRQAVKNGRFCPGIVCSFHNRRGGSRYGACPGNGRYRSGCRQGSSGPGSRRSGQSEEQGKTDGMGNKQFHGNGFLLYLRSLSSYCNTEWGETLQGTGSRDVGPDKRGCQGLLEVLIPNIIKLINYIIHAFPNCTPYCIQYNPVCTV